MNPLSQRTISSNSDKIEMRSGEMGEDSHRLQSIERMKESKDAYAKKLIKTITKTKHFELDAEYINSFLGSIVLVSSGVFGVFLWFFLVQSCGASTQDIGPFWSASTYLSAFQNPQSGLHVCQSFFQASVLTCASIANSGGSPSGNNTNNTAPSPQFCLVPCVLDGFDCATDYNQFNPQACEAVDSNDLAIYYGNYSDFSCANAINPDGDVISCSAQNIDNPNVNEGAPAVPTTITVSYLVCDSIGQSFLNAV